MKVQWIKGNQPEKTGRYWVCFLDKEGSRHCWDADYCHGAKRPWMIGGDFMEQPENILYHADYELPDFPEEN